MNILIPIAVLAVMVIAAIYRSKRLPAYGDSPLVKYGIPADSVMIAECAGGKLLTMQWQARTQSDLNVQVKAAVTITGGNGQIPESLPSYVFVVISAEVRRFALKDLLTRADEISRGLDEYLSNSLADAGHTFSTSLKVELSYPQQRQE